jgi:AraC-like DNA-binding protein
MTDEFASAAMLRLIEAGMRLQGIEAPTMPKLDSARAPLADKRSLLSHIVAVHGVGALLRIPDVISSMPLEPTSQALIVARDPADLLERWRRLEVFLHSDHVVVWERFDGESFQLSHRSRRSDRLPRVEESLLVFSLLTVLIETILSKSVQAGPAGAATPWRKDGRWLDDVQLIGQPAWRIWCGPERTDQVEPNFDKIAPRDYAVTIRRVVAADPSRDWSVAELAKACVASPRSLQRRLAQDSLSVTRILGDVRSQAAAALLVKSECSLAEIGFVSGFADQPHFTRSFKKRVGCTPAQYREKFAMTVAHQRSMGDAPQEIAGGRMKTTIN